MGNRRIIRAGCGNVRAYSAVRLHRVRGRPVLSLRRGEGRFNGIGRETVEKTSDVDAKMSKGA